MKRRKNSTLPRCDSPKSNPSHFLFHKRQKIEITASAMQNVSVLDKSFLSPFMYLNGYGTDWIPALNASLQLAM